MSFFFIMLLEERKFLLETLAVVFLVTALFAGYFYNKSRNNERFEEAFNQQRNIATGPQQQVEDAFQQALQKAAEEANPLKVESPLAGVKIDLTKTARETLNPF